MVLIPAVTTIQWDEAHNEPPMLDGGVFLFFLLPLT